MPMYDFQCDCGFNFEKIEPAETSSSECPACGDAADRAFSGFGGYEFQGAEQLIDPGVKSVDHWIGKDAEKRSPIIEKRQHQKKQLKFKHGDEATFTRFSPDPDHPHDVQYDVVEGEDAEKVRELHEFESEFFNAAEGEVEKVDDLNDHIP